MATSFDLQTPPRLASQAKIGTFADVYEKGTKQLTKSFVTVGKGNKDGAEQDDDDDTGGLSVNTASFNLANNIVGAGLVGLAFVANSSGLIPFLTFMLVAGFGSILTLDMLTASADICGWKDYERMAQTAIGVSGKFIVSAVITFQCYGACIAYLVLIVSTAPVISKLLQVEVDPVYLQIGITGLVVLPMCLLKDLSALASSAIAALIIYLLVAFYVVYRGFTDTWYTDIGEVERADGTFASACPVEGIKYIGDTPIAIVKNFPTIIFAYVCHQQAPPVYAELAGGKVEDMNRVNRLSIYMAGFLYICVGTCGYLAYTNNVFGSVLQNLRHCVCDTWSGDPCVSSCDAIICADDDLGASIMNAGFLFAVLTGFPSVHYALRQTLIKMFCAADTKFNWTLHNGIAVFNVAACLLVAIVAKDVSVVFNWAGSIASPMVSFVLPCWIFLVLLKRAGDKVYSTIGVVSGRIFLTGGLVMMVIGIGLNLADTFGIVLE